MSEGQDFIEVKNVFVEYPVSAGLLKTITGRANDAHSVLRDISFSLSQGQWVTIYGESGSGKSTLLRLLAGAITPRAGKVKVNGAAPNKQALAAGYVSSEESEPTQDTVSESLHEFGRANNIRNLPARIGLVTEILEIVDLVNKPAEKLSTTERLKVNLARAAISDVPVILLDDIADQLGVSYLKNIISQLFKGRSVLVATRFTDTAELLDFPILLMHQASLAHFGTCDDLATNLGCPRIVDVWVEGLRYDLLRQLRSHAGVEEVRLLTADQFNGQRLRIKLRSSRYLPAIYDMVSQVDLVKISEIPPSLVDIIARL